MQFVDLIIIYFSLGAPFGVYAITRRRHPSTLGVIAGMAGRILLWPLSATRWFVRWLLTDPAEDQNAHLESIAELGRRIERCAFGGRATPATFECRDLLERYTGLTLSMETATPYSHPMLALTGHTSQAAAACIYRLEEQRIKFHQQRARAEFIELILSLSASSPNVIEHAARLAEILGDTKTMAKLMARTGELAGKLEAVNPVVRSAVR